MTWLYLLGALALVGGGMLAAHAWARRRGSLDAGRAARDRAQVIRTDAEGGVAELSPQELLDELRGKR